MPCAKPSSRFAHTMAEMIYSPRFAEELSRVTSKRVENNIYKMLDLIEAVPTVGSTKVPSLIRAEFGEGVLKAVVGPFDIFYEHFENQDVVYVYTLVFQRQAR